MKVTSPIFILLSLFLTFSCNETPIKEDTNDMMSLDWILLKRNIMSMPYMIFLGDEFDFLNNCDDYITQNEECDEYIGYNCLCSGVTNLCSGMELIIVNCNNENCCKLQNNHRRVENCEEYEMCELREYNITEDIIHYLPNGSDCCYERKYYTEGDEGWTYNLKYFFVEPPLYIYKLYWNKNINVSVPSSIPKSHSNDCMSEEYFHPNCDAPLDTTINIGMKSVSIEKLGWLEREEGGYEYIHYFPLDDYLLFEGGDDLDISDYKVVDYQLRE